MLRAAAASESEGLIALMIWACGPHSLAATLASKAEHATTCMNAGFVKEVTTQAGLPADPHAKEAQKRVSNMIVQYHQGTA